MYDITGRPIGVGSRILYSYSTGHMCLGLIRGFREDLAPWELRMNNHEIQRFHFSIWSTRAELLEPTQHSWWSWIKCVHDGQGKFSRILLITDPVHHQILDRIQDEFNNLRPLRY